MKCALQRSVAVVVGMLWLLVLGSCAGVPPAELRTYSDSFSQAQEAGNAIYRAMIPALQAGEADPGDNAEPGKLVASAGAYPLSLGPETYDRSGCDPELAAFAALQARCAALAAVASFNKAMLDLQGGASAGAVQSQLSGLETGAATLTKLISVPGVSAVFAAAQTLFPALESAARELATAADRAALKARFDQARPLIDQLLTALQNDVPAIYNVMRAYYNQRLVNLDLAIGDALKPAFRAAASRAAPGDPGAAMVRQALDARFETIFAGTEATLPARLQGLESSVSGAPPFGQRDAGQIDTALDAAEPLVVQFKAAGQSWQSFRQALGAYDLMLTQVRTAFAQLASASDNPFAGGGGSAQLLDSALVIRDQANLVQKHLAATH